MCNSDINSKQIVPKQKQIYQNYLITRHCIPPPTNIQTDIRHIPPVAEARALLQSKTAGAFCAAQFLPGGTYLYRGMWP